MLRTAAPQRAARPDPTGRAGFTLVELLVTIGIIALLLSILLPALNVAINRSQRAASNMQLESVSRAIQAYQMDHGALPGPVAEKTFGNALANNLSGTENLTLGLLGQLLANGSGDYSPAAEVNVELDNVGDGPMDVNTGRKWDAYFDPKPEQVYAIEGAANQQMPELVDQSSGMPLLYWRVMQGEDNDTPVGPWAGFNQVGLRTNQQYLDSSGLTNQDGDTFNQTAKSLISPADDGTSEDNLAWLVVDEDLSDLSDNTANDDNDTINGGYVLVSPGPDGIYFSSDDVDGATALNSVDQRNEFDDIVIVGSR